MYAKGQPPIHAKSRLGLLGLPLWRSSVDSLAAPQYSPVFDAALAPGFRSTAAWGAGSCARSSLIARSAEPLHESAHGELHWAVLAVGDFESAADERGRARRYVDDADRVRLGVADQLRGKECDRSSALV